MQHKVDALSGTIPAGFNRKIDTLSEVIFVGLTIAVVVDAVADVVAGFRGVASAETILKADSNAAAGLIKTRGLCGLRYGPLGAGAGVIALHAIAACGLFHALAGVFFAA